MTFKQGPKAGHSGESSTKNFFPKNVEIFLSLFWHNYHGRTWEVGRSLARKASERPTTCFSSEHPASTNHEKSVVGNSLARRASDQPERFSFWSLVGNSLVGRSLARSPSEPKPTSHVSYLPMSCCHLGPPNTAKRPKGVGLPLPFGLFNSFLEFFEPHLPTCPHDVFSPKPSNIH